MRTPSHLSRPRPATAPAPAGTALAPGAGGRVPRDRRERIVRPNDAEPRKWIKARATGPSTGPSAWDGCAATGAAQGSF